MACNTKGVIYGDESWGTDMSRQCQNQGEAVISYVAVDELKGV